MNKYDVYKHPTIGYAAIKNGFSWPGFFFTWIWAFIKKLWDHGIILLLAVIILPTIGKILGDTQKWPPDFGQPFKCILPTHPAA